MKQCIGYVILSIDITSVFVSFANDVKTVKRNLSITKYAACSRKFMRIVVLGISEEKCLFSSTSNIFRVFLFCFVLFCFVLFCFVVLFVVFVFVFALFCFGWLVVYLFVCFLNHNNK